MSAPDWVSEMFPGDGLEIPSDVERDCADEVIASAARRWNEKAITIDRTVPNEFGGDVPTNRAFMRSRLRRWWAKAPKEVSP